MEIDIVELKKTVVNRNTTFEALAFELGIDRSTLYRKLKRGAAGVTLKDMYTISDCLGLSPTEESTIFGGRYGSHM